jgi:carbon-monoxide dehydrogenase medium subunit
LQPNEILTEVRFAAPPREMAWSILEVSRRHGDFALVGVVAGLAIDQQRKLVSGARLVYFGVGPTPIRAKEAEQALMGERAEEAAFDSAGQIARREIDPSNDIHATAEYRRSVAAVLTRRALNAALQKIGAN